MLWYVLLMSLCCDMMCVLAVAGEGTVTSGQRNGVFGVAEGDPS